MSRGSATARSLPLLKALSLDYYQETILVWQQMTYICNVANSI